MIRVLVLLLLAWSLPVAAQASAPGARVQIPENSLQYRRAVEQAAAEYFGLRASPARLGAQIHQESLWREDARSPVSAMGLGQFMPRTAIWLPEVCPELGAFDPWSPDQAIRAAACYNRFLYTRVRNTASECDRWAMTLAGYNGGASWVTRDRAMASSLGLDPAIWFGHVEHHSPRGRAAFNENRGYVRRILTVLEPAYLANGWDGQAVCP